MDRIVLWTSLAFAIALLATGLTLILLYTSQWWVGFVFLILSILFWGMFAYYMILYKREDTNLNNHDNMKYGLGVYMTPHDTSFLSRDPVGDEYPLFHQKI